MIQLTDRLWVGGSTGYKNVGALRIGAILNVAHDLQGVVGWPQVEYMQVGLVDGPGNLISSYIAAVLALDSLLERHATMVCCHTGSRSMAVALMHMSYVSPGRSWDDWLNILGERMAIDLPVPHEVHRTAFDMMVKHQRTLRRAVGAKV